MFSIDFEAIEKREQLMKWLTESWGPAVSRPPPEASAPQLWLVFGAVVVEMGLESCNREPTA